MDEGLVGETHLGLGRVDVDVDAVERHLEEQVHFGAAFLDRRRLIGVEDGVRDGLVPYDPAVDEDVLGAARRPLIGQRGDDAGEPQAVGGAIDCDQVGTIAVDLEQPVGERPRRRTTQHQAPGAGERHADPGMAERELSDDLRDVRRLGGVGLQELAAGRQVEEQIFHRDRRALGHADRPRRFDLTGGDADLGARGGRPGPGPQREARHRGDARQRFAPETQRADRRQIGGRGDLAGRVSLETQSRVVGGHADAVVVDADQPLAAVFDGDHDPSGRGVDGVLDQLLDDRRRALDDLSGGDLVGQVVGQLVDARHLHHQPDRRNQTSNDSEALAMIATTHQNCASAPPGRCGSGTFMP